MRAFGRLLQSCGAIGKALADLGINAPFFVSQNDGTLMSSAHLLEMPVLTFAAGATNSLRGAYFLQESAMLWSRNIGERRQMSA